jgi:hypothetical protein
MIRESASLTCLVPRKLQGDPRLKICALIESKEAMALEAQMESWFSFLWRNPTLKKPRSVAPGGNPNTLTPARERTSEREWARRSMSAYEWRGKVRS